MIFKGSARGDEKAFMVIQNVTAGGAQSITTGNPVQLAMAAASFNGTQAILSTSALQTQGFLGIAYRDIAPNAYADIQIYGPVASVLLSNAGSSVTINAGDPLIPSPAGFYSGNPSYLAAGLKYIIATNVPAAVSAVAYASGFVRTI